jgi:hypothetical protein
LVLLQVGDMPNVADLDKDALAALIKQLYEQSCSVFADKFNMEHEVRRELSSYWSIFCLRRQVQHGA